MWARRTCVCMCGCLGPSSSLSNEVSVTVSQKGTAHVITWWSMHLNYVVMLASCWCMAACTHHQLQVFFFAFLYNHANTFVKVVIDDRSSWLLTESHIWVQIQLYDECNKWLVYQFSHLGMHVVLVYLARSSLSLARYLYRVKVRSDIILYCSI